MNADDINSSACSSIRRVTVFGLVLNVILSILKGVIGVLSGSISLVADSLHSLSDMLTDLAVLVGVHFGARVPDEKHQYGHGRYETFSAIFIAVLLMAVAAVMIYYAAMDIVKANIREAKIPVLIAAVISIVVKEFLYVVTRRVAVKTHSTATYANAWHHRSDAFSSVAVVIGYFATLGGMHYGDQIAAIVVGIMIAYVAARVLTTSMEELNERSVDKDTLEFIKALIDNKGRVRQWHKLRTRTIGREIFLDLHILVDPALNIAQAHDIAEDLEQSLHDELTRPVNIIIHVEPDVPELRKH